MITLHRDLSDSSSHIAPGILDLAEHRNLNSVFEVGYIYEKMRAFNDIVGLCYGYGTFAFEASAFEFQ